MALEMIKNACVSIASVSAHFFLPAQRGRRTTPAQQDRLNRLGVGALLLTRVNGVLPGGESHVSIASVSAHFFLLMREAWDIIRREVSSQSPRCRRTSSYESNVPHRYYRHYRLNRLGVGALLLTTKESRRSKTVSSSLNRLGVGALLLT